MRSGRFFWRSNITCIVNERISWDYYNFKIFFRAFIYPSISLRCGARKLILLTCKRNYNVDFAPFRPSISVRTPLLLLRFSNCLKEWQSMKNQLWKRAQNDFNIGPRSFRLYNLSYVFQVDDLVESVLKAPICLLTWNCSIQKKLCNPAL